MGLNGVLTTRLYGSIYFEAQMSPSSLILAFEQTHLCQFGETFGVEILSPLHQNMVEFNLGLSQFLRGVLV